MQNWFYADAQHQQQGPVDAATLAAAYRDGRVGADTLVWREGLAGWVKLAEVAAQLGLVVVREPVRASPSAAAPRVVAKPPSSSSTWIVVLVVCVFGGLVVLGILAAIALPAYQDYTLRAQVSQAYLVGESLKPEVAAFRESEARCPRNGDDPIGSAESYADTHVASIEVGPLGDEDGDCAIRVTFASTNARVAGKQLTWSLDADGEWHASSDIDRRFLPKSVRDAID